MYWFLVLELDVSGVKEDSWAERVRCDVVNAAFEGAGVVGRVGRGAGGGAGRPLLRLVKPLSMAGVRDAGENSLGKMVHRSGAITTHVHEQLPEGTLVGLEGGLRAFRQTQEFSELEGEGRGGEGGGGSVLGPVWTW